MATVEHILGARLAPVRARLLRSAQLGAEARRVKDGYEVRLNGALPAIVHFAFNSLLRTPQFMYGIGDAESEQLHRESSKRIPLALPRGVKVEEAIVAITSVSRPRDTQRAATAVLMSELAVAYCAYHELAHVLLGHVDAHCQWTGCLGLLEMAESVMPDGRASARVRMVWEYEADLVAANMLLQDMVANDAEPVFRDAYGGDNDSGVLARFQAMLGAILVVFLLVAQATPIKQRTHPEPLIRFAAVANDSAAALVEQQPQLQLSFEQVGEAVNDVALSALSAWSILGLGTSPASPLKNLLNAQRVVERLEHDREELHPLYSCFAAFYPFKR
ncbi:MAG: hypothetical protein E6Q99_00360 [Elusimicrobia bacterium]|nr:MAG: hypothetical protein E6Q99_00360 [Elusimicrobiota bacterium]